MSRSADKISPIVPFDRIRYDLVMPHKKGTKLKGKAIQLHKQASRENEAREIQELNKRIAQEAPPQGSNPLSFSNPADSFTPDGPPTAAAIAAAAAESETATAQSASSGSGSDSTSNKKKAEKAAKRETSGTVLYGAVRKFDELPISQRTKTALTAAGFTRLTDIQRAAIPHALAGRDILGAARTGSGKTLAYLVPVLEKLFRERWGKLDGIGALILVPTRELAMQIFDVLRLVGKTHRYSAGLIIGGKEVQEEQERILGMNILICTPGRLLHHQEQTYGFNCDNLQILVLDEADRMLDMGFQQAMNDILGYLPKERQTLLFSATQTKNLKDLAKLSLKSPEYIAVHETNTTAVPNKLVQHYTIISADQKINLLYSYIKTHLQAKTIVFLSSGKQVRFLYEIFRRIRPGVPLMHIHGKMKQQKRMSIYYDFCNKDHALIFCTDLAARGLDFPAVDWVVQFDTPENVATYIHRVGRTARYRAEGKSLLFLLPSEINFLEELLASKKITEIKKVKADQTKMKDVTSQFAGFLAENTELKFLAQKAFISYVRSIALQGNKNVFKINEIPFEPLAKSMGLIGTPKVKLPKQSTTVSAAHREKNMPHALRELLAESGSKKKKSKTAAEQQPLSQVDKILTRKNTTVFSESRQKLRAADSDEEEEDEDILQVKRKDHELSEDEISSESEAEAEEKQDGETKSSKKSKKSSTSTSDDDDTDFTPSAFRQAGQAQLSDAFLHVASARVAEHDPQDRQREHERVRAKHQAKKMAIKKRARAEAEEARAAGGDDEDEQVVVTLGRPDGEEEDEDGAPMSDVDDDDDEQEHEEDEPTAKQPSQKKRKLDIQDQEALALKILNAQ